ncbi:MAG: MarR family transcriptional regulator [Actinobacteria bacterium]|nr:MarR family transcriptional regulator [Actinomycetota bacterium]
MITNNLIKEVVLHIGNMSITDYCILQKLLMLDRSMELSEFRGFLLLKKNTISIAVSRLEQNGYISKETNKNDYRKCFITLTSDGRELAQKLSHAIRDSLLANFWQTFEDERVNWGMVIDSQAFYLHVGDSERADLDFKEDGNFVSPSWIIALKYISQLWTLALAKEVKLSLSEFRVLQLLVISQASYCTIEIARKLEIESSVVSRVIRSLRNAGLVDLVQSKDDRRSYLSTVTSDGECVYEKGRLALEGVTDAYYSSISDADKKRLSLWHETMYKHFEPK